jgi:hypothetical protein
MLKLSKAILLGLIVCLFFGSYLNASINYPSDFCSSKVVLVEMNFKDFISTLDIKAGGFDDYAQRHYYKGYHNEVLKFQDILRKHHIEFEKVSVFSDSTKGDYLINFQGACTGELEPRSAYTCIGMFYLMDLKTKVRYEPFCAKEKVFKKLCK